MRSVSSSLCHTVSPSSSWPVSQVAQTPSALKKLLNPTGVWAWGLNLQYLDFVRIVCRPHSDGCAMLTIILGCPCAYKIPFSPGFPPCVSPCLDVPLCRLPHHTTAMLVATLLDDNTRFVPCRGILGGTARALPTSSSALLFTSLPTTVTQRKISLPVHTKTRQRWGLGRSPGWEIWGYHPCRCFDELCQSPWRSLRLRMHVLFQGRFKHSYAKSRLWRCFYGPNHYQHTQHHSAQTVSYRVYSCQETASAFRWMGRSAPRQCAKVFQRVSCHPLERIAKRL
jgi:hypothetical protein